MKKMAASILAVSLVATGLSFAQQTPLSSQTAVQQVQVGNKICPVSREKVGQMGPPVKYKYNGKVYNLCCPMCKKDFKKDPGKYRKIAENEVKGEKKQ